MQQVDEPHFFISDQQQPQTSIQQQQSPPQNLYQATLAPSAPSFHMTLPPQEAFMPQTQRPTTPLQSSYNNTTNYQQQQQQPARKRTLDDVKREYENRRIHGSHPNPPTYTHYTYTTQTEMKTVQKNTLYPDVEVPTERVTLTATTSAIPSQESALLRRFYPGYN